MPSDGFTDKAVSALKSAAAIFANASLRAEFVRAPQLLYIFLHSPILPILMSSIIVSPAYTIHLIFCPHLYHTIYS